MLLDELQKCIKDMDEIRMLEQMSNDSQKQEKADRMYTTVVADNHKIVMGIEERRKYVCFVPSVELKSEMLTMLANSREAVKMGLFQEARTQFLQNNLKNVKDIAAAEWGMFYARISDKRIRTLMTVKGITPNREKTGYVIAKLKNGAAINYDDNDKVRRLAEGIIEADQIIKELRLNDEVMSFLDKVSERSATIFDLTDSLSAWITKEGLSGKFMIGFKD